MKLAKIDHTRCYEHDCTTWVWVPDEMTQKEFIEIVARAEKAYKDFADSWPKIQERPRRFYSLGQFLESESRNNPDLTMAQMQEKFAVVQAESRAAELEYRKGYRSFSEYVRAEDERILPFWEAEVHIGTEIDWGHRHSQPLDYEDTVGDASRDDLPGPLKTAAL